MWDSARREKLPSKIGERARRKGENEDPQMRC